MVEIFGVVIYIEVEGNIDGFVIKIDDVNFCQGGVIFDVVCVVGGVVIVIGGFIFICFIEVVLEMVCVEVKGDLGSLFINLVEFKVKGIYLNNVKQKRVDVVVVKIIKVLVFDWMIVYIVGGIKLNLYNIFIGIFIIKFDFGKVDGYNFFLQDFYIVFLFVVVIIKEEVVKYYFYVIMEVEYKMNGVGVFLKIGWLNVVVLKDNIFLLYIGEFVNGKVY